MKRMVALALILILIISGCAPKKDKEVLDKDKDNAKEQVSIIPSYKLSDDFYKTILPFRPSKARGVITNQITNRVDIEEMEEGLQRHSTKVFDPKNHYFEEGQYISDTEVYEWLGRKETDKNQEKDKDKKDDKKAKDEGLNPPIKETEDEKQNEKEHRDNPRYLSHILEQDYLKRKDDNSVQLAGVSIGLAMKSVYRFQTEIGGPYKYEKISTKEMQAQAEKYAQMIVDRVRQIEGLEQVPIMIAVFREEEQGSPVPGSYVMNTVVGEGQSKIDSWEQINESHVLFPSEQAKKSHLDDYQVITNFGTDIAEYFPNYVGVVGEGFYVNKELQRLKIEIPIEFYGKNEVIGFTQYAYGLIQEKFPNHYDIEVQIKSNKQLESLITREKGEKEPTVHILH